MQTPRGAGPGRRRVRRGPGRRRRGLRRGALRARAAPDRRAGRCRGRGGGQRRVPRGRAARRPRPGTPIRVGALLTAMRHAARSMEIAELVVRYRDDGVVGLRHRRRRGGLPAHPAPRRLRVPPAGERPLHHPRRRGASGCRRSGRPSSGAARDRLGPRRAHHRRHHRRHADGDGDPRPARGLRARQADPAGDVPVVQRADRRGRRRSPTTRSGCWAGCTSGSPSTPTTG